MSNKVLIIEPNKHLREIIMFHLESSFSFEVIEVSSIQEARQSLFPDINLIICNDYSGKYTELLELKNKYLKESLFFLIKNNKETLYYRNDIDAQFHISECLTPLNQEISNRFEIDSTYNALPFTRVSIKTLAHFENLEEDIYIKLGKNPGRYIKLFNKGDVVEQEDIDKYQIKSVDFLYIDKSAYKWILKVANDNILNIINAKKGQYYTLDCNREQIITKEIVYLANKHSQEVQLKKKKIINKIRKNKNIFKLFKNINSNKNNYYKKRMNMVAMISCALAKELNWNSDSSFEKLIYVSYLHDIVLFNRPDLYTIKNIKEFDKLAKVKEFTEQDRELFLKHSVYGEALIAKDPYAPSETAKMIRQHHEHPKQEGFPDNIQSQLIIPFSAIFILSLECAQYILDNPDWNLLNFYESAKKEYSSTNFHKPLQALKKFIKKSLNN